MTGVFSALIENITIAKYNDPIPCRTSTNISSVMLGPILIHSNKSCRSYFTIPTNLVILNPKISDLKAVEANGEQKLFDTFCTCFSEANHLLCTIHIKGNIIKNCNDLGID